MKKITLTTEELNECLQAMQEHKEFVLQMTKDNYIFNVIVKDGELLLNFTPKDGELVFFNIITKEGKLLFDEDVIFAFILGNEIIKAGTKSGKIIEIDNIISKSK